MVALILVALALGLSNFAAAIGIGVSGTSARTRIRVGVIFGVFEAGMPIAGLVLGRGLARALGGAAHWTSAGLLIATGAWTLVQAIRSGPPSGAWAASASGGWSSPGSRSASTTWPSGSRSAPFTSAWPSPRW